MQGYQECICLIDFIFSVLKCIIWETKASEMEVECFYVLGHSLDASRERSDQSQEPETHCPDLLPRWQRPSHLSCHLLPPRMPSSRKLEVRMKPNYNPVTLMWDAGVLTNSWFIGPDTHSYMFKYVLLPADLSFWKTQKQREREKAIPSWFILLNSCIS